MSGKISLLDCTLRDGAYIVDANFGAPAIRGIIRKLQDAGVELIECGWLKNSPHVTGTSYYHVPQDLAQYLEHKTEHQTFVVMIDWDRYDVEQLPPCDGKTVDAVRVVFPYGKHREGIAVGMRIKEKGYRVFFQAANTLAYTDADLDELAAAINEAEPVGLSVVDTFGAMYEEDLERIVQRLDAKLKPSIALGFHSHNNMQLSFALSMHFVKLLRDRRRDLIVDASLCGMGRGAGNATTELVASFLDKKCGGHYSLDDIMDAIDVYMEYFKETYQWGYSTAYFIAGLYCCHVNNIAYLQKNHRANARDMRNIIESLPEADRRKYDYDLLEQKYLQNQSYHVDDTAAVAALTQAVKGRTVLLVAPGKSSLDEQAKIKRYIWRKKPLVIGVNAILPGYRYDYLFFNNSARLEYAATAWPDVLAGTPKILLSNIRNEAQGKDEQIIAFQSVIKRGWTHYDNAVICCLRLMERISPAAVVIAGFDGFKSKYNQSYADPFLPTLNPSRRWKALNEEIREMFIDFRRSAQIGRKIRFLTPSIFEE